MYLVTCYSCNTPEHSLLPYNTPNINLCILLHVLLKSNKFKTDWSKYFYWTYFRVFFVIKKVNMGAWFFICAPSIFWYVTNCHVPSFFSLRKHNRTHHFTLSHSNLSMTLMILATCFWTASISFFFFWHRTARTGQGTQGGTGHHNT